MSGRHLLAAPLAALLVAAGCASTPTSTQVARALENADQACHIDRVSKIVLGPIKLALARGLLNIAAEEDGAEAREFLRHLRRVEVSTYHVAAACRAHDDVIDSVSAVSNDGWIPMLTEAGDATDRSWVMVREEGPDAVTGMLVVSMDRGVLEVVRLDGRIDALLVAAISDQPTSAADLLSVDF